MKIRKLGVGLNMKLILLRVRRGFIWTSLISVFLLTGGCENPFNPDTITGSEDYIIRSNSTPRNVLENLETAYNQQNLDLFISCLSQSFRFELLSSETDLAGVDMDGDGIKDSWWDYDKEVEYHRNLFKHGSSQGDIPSPNNIYLNLQIPIEDVWHTDSQEGREDWIVIPVYFNLSLTLFSSTTISADGYARFYLRPEGDEWRIIIWRDESNI